MPQTEDLTGDGGVIKTVIEEGKGSFNPTLGNKVCIDYEGYLEDGTQFDKNTQFQVLLDKGALVKGLETGILSMKRDEVAEFTIKSDYGYGEMGNPPKVPPNASLKFRVKLNDWKLEDLSPNKDGGILVQYLLRGEGRSTPNDGATVNVHLVGYHDGKKIDDRTLTFVIGEGCDHDIPYGLEIVLQKLRKKSKVHVTLKPKYAFKEKGLEKLAIPENATLEYDLELLSFEKALEMWEMSSEERLEQGKIAKEKGTHFFQSGKIDAAVKHYQRVVEFLDQEQDLKGPKEKERKVILLGAYLNLALCHIREGSYLQARRAAEKALDLDAKNVKALYRKGLAHLELADFDQAKESFEKVLALEPNNKAAQSQLAITAARHREHLHRERQTYRNMFEKFAKQDRKNSNYDARLPEPDYWDPKDRDRVEMEENLELGAALLEEGVPNLDRAPA